MPRDFPYGHAGRKHLKVESHCEKVIHSFTPNRPLDVTSRFSGLVGNLRSVVEAEIVVVVFLALLAHVVSLEHVSTIMCMFVILLFFIITMFFTFESLRVSWPTGLPPNTSSHEAKALCQEHFL